MSESSERKPPVDLGIYSRVAADTSLDPADKIALVVSAIWLVMCTAFLAIVGLGGSEELGGLRFLIVVLAVLLPVALIWIGSIAVKSARIMREESERLAVSMDAMRQIYITQAQMAATTMGPNVERKIDEIVKGQKRAESAMAEFATTRPISVPAPSPERPAVPPMAPPTVMDGQPDLALGTPAEMYGTPVSTADFITAMNFPETADDRAGFDALRRALADRRAAVLIQASQDVLTLLSQDGIYMDDLTPDRSKTDIWRRFASGERGPTVSGLGGVRDRSSLALSAARMRQDSIFRDASHHFLRTFDKTLASIADRLSDQELAALTETRTARAFMLLGRVAGIFD
ncbi:hypothetical protein [uncultured Boseongicola sp.]|jgi:hypothetical protein|uniref:hypothetical protein n=1 Tax=uncultured Boseongicola sp. TaxID=1648499 RepID=UPI0026045137|nr:hypothetical protein [uncultured Boseongicola sp.]